MSDAAVTPIRHLSVPLLEDVLTSVTNDRLSSYVGPVALPLRPSQSPFLSILKSVPELSPSWIHRSQTTEHHRT